MTRLRNAFICLALLPFLASAGTITTWTGNTDPQWTQATNWDNGLPGPGSDTRIQSTGNNPVVLATSVAVDALTTGAANSLVLQPGAVLQAGQLTNAGSVTLAGGTLTLLGGPSVNSGSIQTASGGLSQLGGNITNTGTIGIANNSALEFTGGSTYTNNGTIALNSSGTLLLTGSGTVTLTGNGSLTLGTTSSQIAAETPGLTLVNDTAHSITGSGVVGGGGPTFTLDNRGTVTATGGAGLIFAPSAAVLNSGTIQATGGPVQFINGAANTGGTIRADGNMVSFTGPSAVTGGNLDVINNGNMVFQGTPVSNAALHIGGGASYASLVNASFTGGSIDVQGLLVLQSSAITGSTVTNSGSIQTASGGLNQLGGNISNTGTIGIANGSALEFTGGSTYTNNGTIALNSSGALLLTGSGTVTLTGNGSLTMGSTSSQISAETPGLTLVNDTAHTITGSGVLGGGGPTFTLDNRGTVTATGGAGLIFAPSVAVLNSGTIQATGGPVQFINGAANTGGTIRADGNMVSFTGPSAVTGGNLDVINNGNMVFQGTPVSNAALHIGPGASYASLVNANFAGGSIDVQGLLVLQNSAITGSTVTNSGSIQTASGGLNQLGGNITNTGTIGIANGSALEFTGGSTYTNNGTIALNNSGALLLTGSGTVTLTGNGSLTMGTTSSQISAEMPGLTLVNDTAHSITGSGVVGGGGPTFSLDNRGTITATGAGLMFAPSVAFQNNGVLAVNAGAQVFVLGTFGNFAAQTLTGGTYSLSGVFQFMNADIVTNAADITLDGAGRIIDQASMDGLRNFAVNSGSFTAENGAILPSLGQFTNSGSMTIGAGTTLNAIDYTQTDGATVVNGTLDSSVTLDGGSLSGTGHVTGALVNVAGSVNPGNSPGALYVDIDYDQGIAGILNMEIGPGGFDQLFVGGAANLDGTLNILLASGYAPLYGQTFDIMQYSSFSGAFANVNLPNPWSVLIYGDHELTFEYLTPEPATWLLIAGGLGLILRRRVRRG